MRFKISLEVMPQVSGNVLPISYQCELAKSVYQMITQDLTSYESWLTANGLPADSKSRHYALSNLYVPKIFVNQDRLFINVPRVQFWISFLNEIGTREMLEKSMLDHELVVGDTASQVTFKVSDIEDVSPVEFKQTMDYQSLSPVVVQALRANKTLEYLGPSNRYFAQFLVEELIERWESVHQCPYTGDRRFFFQLLQPERRKAVTIYSGTPQKQKVVGYMLKFRLAIDPVLQEFAYVTGIGDKIDVGFGYLELLHKKKS